MSVHISRALTHIAPDRFIVNRWVELALLGCVFTAVVLAIIRITHVGPRIRSRRHAVLAAAYYIFLYRRSAIAVLRGEARLLWYNFMMLVWLSPALLGGGILFGLAHGFLNGRYAYAPLSVGSDFVVRLSSVDGTAEPGNVLGARDDFVITASVHVPATSTVWTRLRPLRPGIHTVSVGGESAWVNVACPNRPTCTLQVVGDVALRVFYPPVESTRWFLHWTSIVFFACATATRPLAYLIGVYL